MSNKKTILLDMDAVTVDMLTYWLAEYNRESGENITIKDLTEYRVDNLVGDKVLIYDILHKQDFFYKPTPMPNAVESINKLRAEHNVIFVTQRPRHSRHACYDKERWIMKYFPDFDLTNIIFAHKKYMVAGDILFDDNPEHLQKWKEYNPEGKTATISYPYNKHIITDFRSHPEEAWLKFVEFANKN